VRAVRSIVPRCPSLHGGRPASRALTRRFAMQCRVVKGWWDCPGLWRRDERVGSGAGAGEEAEAGLLGELGEHVAGLDLELLGEFLAGPAAAGIGVHDGCDAVSAG
jgi:hypothetical protein